MTAPLLSGGAHVRALLDALPSLDTDRLDAWGAHLASVLVGARTAAQLRASLSSEDVDLPAQITAVLDEVSAPVVAYPERF